MTRKIILLILMLAGIAGSIWGITGVYQVFIKGHGVVMNTTNDVPWGIQISTYVFLALVGAGCIFVNFFGHITNLKAYAVIGPRVIALALFAVLGGLGALLFEIGWPTRIMNFITSPNFASPMAWMVFLYSIEIVLIAVEYLLIKISPDSKISKVVMWVAFIATIATTSMLGAIFGIVEAVPYYFSPLIPIFFLSVAFLCGTALASAVAYISGANYHSALQPLRKMVGIGIAIVFVISLWRFVIGSTSGSEGYEIFKMTATKFWTASIFLGLIIPFALALASFMRGFGWMILVASIIILTTQFMARYDFIIDGFRIPQFQSVWAPDIITYTPSSVEVSIVVAAFAFVLFLYSIAEFIGILKPPHTEGEVSQ